ncbi:AAA family ATPase [Longimicrobium sp.]|jgi:energy-coupling factor transporter ATP-binding protein EcfA2|uniref:AAA family ATPase n=1 Tax=Longimicrobium sp. TaxID=2029185 RepID=UPI002F942CA3
MPNKVERIKLQGFRGATTRVTVDLSSDKPAVLVFGENGSGKSTLIDAIDMVCNGQPGSVRERSSTTVKDHLHSLGSKPNDLAVEVDFGGSTWKAGVDGGKIVRSPNTTPPPAAILRRGRLLKLVEAAPAERYDEMKRLIGVEKVEAGERLLREALRDKRKDYDRAAADLERARASLDRLWDAEGRPRGDSLAWAAAVRAAQQVEAVAEMQRCNSVLATLGAAEKTETHAGTAEKARDDARALVGRARDALAAAEAAGAEGTAALAELLERVRGYLAAVPDAGVCPVCERPADAGELRQAVEDRLNRMNALSAAARVARDAEGKAERAELAVIDAHERSESARADFRAACTDAGISSAPVTAHDRSKLRSDMELRAGELGKTLHLRNAVCQLLADHGDASERAGALQLLTGRLQRAAQVVREERHTFANGLLDELRTRVNELYEAIHPGEGVALSHLALSATASASVEQGARFGAAGGVPPQAYFSEAHLDTLGFCIWLAVQERTYGGRCVVVLDDVFTSVDMAHLDRIVDVLVSVAGSFDQLILTTHSRHWRDRHRRGAAAGSVAVFELGTWTQGEGIRVVRGRTAREDLAALLKENPLGRQAAASAAGVLMEDVLDGLAVRHGCSMPRNASGLYELKPLLDGTTKLAKTLVVERMKRPQDGGEVEERIELKPLHASVVELYEVRNQVGAHANPASEDIPDAKVRDFCHRVAAFADALHCRECGEVPDREDAGYRHCRCRRTRSSPVRA